MTGDRVTDALQAHTASVSALRTWRGPNGEWRLASAGDDAAIRIWTLATTVSAGPPVAGHTGGVLDLTAWRASNGRDRLASASSDGTLVIRNSNTGELERRVRFAVGLWSVTSWTQHDGTCQLAVGDYSGVVRVLDAETGDTLGAQMHGEDGAIRALVHWWTRDGRSRLGCASGTAVYVWDPETRTQTIPPLTGHTGLVRALATWETDDGGIRLASAGDDGTIRLWDPERGVSLRTIEVGAVQIWGLSDVPAEVDLLGRGALIEALADQLCPPADTLAAGEPGPTVVTIEGPWGSGKSTTMRLIDKRLHAIIGSTPNPPVRDRHLTVREAMRSLRGTTISNQREPSDSPATPTPTRRGVATAWFNPWAHESGEQIWAGLLQSIIDAVSPILFPNEAQRDRYWFSHNLPRVNHHGVRRALQRRIVSPLLGVALIAVVVPAALALAQLGKSVLLLGRSVTTLDIALLLPATFVIAGIVHTVSRYARGAAVDYLPIEIFTGPVANTARHENAIMGDGQGSIADPLRAARAGSLYLRQHDMIKLLADTATSGHDLIIFVDDLDRCRANTTAEVFEAINLFLSGVGSQAGLRAHFVIGLDPVVVAAHLDRYYASMTDLREAAHGDDPSPGWAFLRKLIQLPVIMPRIPDTGIDQFVDATLRTSAKPAPHTRKSTTNSAHAPDTLERASALTHAVGRRQVGSSRGLESGQGPTLEEVIPHVAIEQHPEIRNLIADRLRAQPNRSIREAKRLLNLWQLYERILAKIEPLEDPSTTIARARAVMVIAEIVTRWPALQHHLHRHTDGSVNGVAVLAAAATDDRQWRTAVDSLQIDRHTHAEALTNLRGLLAHQQGSEIPRLAGLLF